MLERDIEAKLKKITLKLGLIPYKWVSPGNSGVPDRIVFGPFPYVWLIELKRPGGKLSKTQQAQIRRLARLGWTVRVISTEEELSRVVQEVQAILLSIAGD